MKNKSIIIAGCLLFIIFIPSVFAVPKEKTVSAGSGTRNKPQYNLIGQSVIGPVLTTLSNFKTRLGGIFVIKRYPPRITNIRVDNIPPLPNMDIKNRTPKITFHINSPKGVRLLNITIKDKNGNGKTYILNDFHYINPTRRNGQVTDSDVVFTLLEFLPPGRVEVTIYLEPFNHLFHGIASETFILTVIGDPPIIYNIFIDGKNYVEETNKLLPGEKLHVRPNPEITFSVSSESGLNTGSIGIKASGTTQNRDYLISQSRHLALISFLANQINIPRLINVAFPIDSSESLEPGPNIIDLTATNDFGNDLEKLDVMVASNAELDGDFLIWPNPFNYSKNNGNLEFHYKLTQDTNTTIYIFNVVGEVVKKLEFAAQSNGGRINFNSPSWDPTTFYGTKLANGMYLAILKLENSGRQYKAMFVIL